MEETIQVTIIPEDFRDAPRFDSITDCPLANALKRVFPKKEIRVGLYSVTIAEPGKHYVNSTRYTFDYKEWGVRVQDVEFNGQLIDDLCIKAKKSLEGIPSKTLTLTPQK